MRGLLLLPLFLQHGPFAFCPGEREGEEGSLFPKRASSSSSRKKGASSQPTQRTPCWPSEKQQEKKKTTPPPFPRREFICRGPFTTSKQWLRLCGKPRVVSGANFLSLFPPTSTKVHDSNTMYVERAVVSLKSGVAGGVGPEFLPEELFLFHPGITIVCVGGEK